MFLCIIKIEILTRIVDNRAKIIFKTQKGLRKYGYRLFKRND